MKIEYEHDYNLFLDAHFNSTFLHKGIMIIFSNRNIQVIFDILITSEFHRDYTGGTILDKNKSKTLKRPVKSLGGLWLEHLSILLRENVLNAEGTQMLNRGAYMRRNPIYGEERYKGIKSFGRCVFISRQLGRDDQLVSNTRRMIDSLVEIVMNPTSSNVFNGNIERYKNIAFFVDNFGIKINEYYRDREYKTSIDLIFKLSHAYSTYDYILRVQTHLWFRGYDRARMNEIQKMTRKNFENFKNKKPLLERLSPVARELGGGAVRLLSGALGGVMAQYGRLRNRGMTNKNINIKRIGEVHGGASAEYWKGEIDKFLKESGRYM